MNLQIKSWPVLLALAWGVVPSLAMACATCGCSTQSDAALGYENTSGWRASIEFDYIDQSQLRSGSSGVSQASVAAINDAGGNQEVENRTINRYWNLGLSYRMDSNWQFGLQLPYVDRSHTTYSNAGVADLTADNLSGATAAGIGDARVTVGYQGFLPTHNLGVVLGVKLPTGDYGGQNTQTGEAVGHHPVAFNRGPNAGQLLDTSLNPGTGSTDLIIGAFYAQPVSQNFDVYANAQYQFAIAEKLDQPGADYKPGASGNLSVGLRYEANPVWVPQLQLNLVHKAADSGALADTADTSGTMLYLSPGISVAVAKGLQAYSFVQVPLYSHLDGYQLAPRWTGTVGLSYGF